MKNFIRKPQKRQQSGRTMVETLAVLFIFGLLSVGAVAGVKQAYLQIDVNKITKEVQIQRAYYESLTPTNRKYGTSPVAYPYKNKLDYTYTSAFPEDADGHTDFTRMKITATRVPKNVCEKFSKEENNSGLTISVRQDDGQNNCSARYNNVHFEFAL